MALDTLERRSRRTPTSHPEKRIEQLTERKLMFLEFLHRHGDLPTDYLLDLSEVMGWSCVGRARDDLTSLFHDRKTPHLGTYLSRPEGQFVTLERNQSLIHSISDRPAAEKALREAHLWRENAFRHDVGDKWRHDLMVSCFTASIHLACLREPEKYRYIHSDEIWQHKGRPHFTVRYRSEDGSYATSRLVPDDIFGIEIKELGKTRYFALEVDKGTETVRSVERKNIKTLVENDLQYRQLIGGKEYLDTLQVEGAMVLINLFSKEVRRTNLMKQVRPSNYIVYKSVPTFDQRDFITPPLMKNLLTDAYERVGREPFFFGK